MTSQSQLRSRGVIPPRKSIPSHIPSSKSCQPFSQSSQQQRRPLHDISNTYETKHKSIPTTMKQPMTQPMKHAAILPTPSYIHDQHVDMSDEEEQDEESEGEGEQSELESVDDMNEIHSSNPDTKWSYQQMLCWNDPSLEYCNSVLDVLHANECRYPVASNYIHTMQPDLNGAMRSILLDWLIEVCEEYKLSDQTLLLSVNYIDRFLSKYTVERAKLQLVGCTCMLIAAKYEEIYPPTIDDFVYISDNTYTRDAVLSMEMMILNSLHFALTIVTPLEFAKYLAKQVSCTQKQHSLIHYLLSLYMQDITYLRYLPSITATSIISLTLYLTHDSHWTPILEKSSGYQQYQIEACRRDIHHVHMNVTKGTTHLMKAARTKYASDKFHHVATIPSRPL